MAASDSKITLKLLIDAENNRVLFAESRKDFVDFMFSLLLPLTSITKHVTPGYTLGSVGKLYQSVENINKTNLFGNEAMSTLLQPTDSLTVASSLLPKDSSLTTLPKKTCRCWKCGMLVNSFPSIADGVSSNEDFVKEAVPYMITDDLEIRPLSAIYCINRFISGKNIRLEEKAVVVGMEEMIALLGASLQSATVLTDVFLNSSTKKAEAQSNAEENLERTV